MRLTLVMAAVVIALLAMLGLQKNPVADVSVDAPVRASVEADTGPKIAPATEGTATVKGPPALPPSIGEPEWEEGEVDLPPEGAVLITDPETLNAIKELKHQRDLDALEASPARDTPELKAMEAILAKRGLPRGAVVPVYKMAWNYHHILRGTRNHDLAMAAVAQEKSFLVSDGYGVVGEDFWMEVIAIQPKVFFSGTK